MKYLKMLGLAAIAAVAAMAIVGAGTASADEVCTDKPVNNMCQEGKLITTIEASQVGTGSLMGFVDDTLRDEDILSVSANISKKTGVD